jgi:hypothetical protein
MKPVNKIKFITNALNKTNMSDNQINTIFKYVVQQLNQNYLDKFVELELPYDQKISLINDYMEENIITMKERDFGDNIINDMISHCKNRIALLKEHKDIKENQKQDNPKPEIKICISNRPESILDLKILAGYKEFLEAQKMFQPSIDNLDEELERLSRNKNIKNLLIKILKGEMENDR